MGQIRLELQNQNSALARKQLRAKKSEENISELKNGFQFREYEISDQRVRSSILRRNAVVSTSSNDIVLLSLNFKYHLLDLTNPNDIVRVTSASLLPAGSPVATHYSQSPRCWFQNAAFQLNETTSLYLFFATVQTSLFFASRLN
ncbi:hypothetical protein F511_37963 [Dorcoceras hygrometricum]|uniref:Uncharacterized protein n=1 Tax=Dorcoceras hygrometricum TaxID=472368 RepID=A0A2Z7B1S2_9LAMI|nr:hypothetical protein F511_37963 [Dorcoceras hygrometricum]